MQPGGGDDIKELLRQHGKEAIYSLADSAGLRVGKRLRCPFRGCSDQPPERAPNLGVFAAESGVYKVKCHRCGEGGDLLDLIQAVRGVGPSEALAQLRSGASPTPRPALRVVPAPRGEDPDKLPPAEWKRLWEALAREDAHGRAYLESRGLEESPLVRFVTEAAGDSRLKKFAKHGRRVAMLMTDVVGNPRGIQARLAREAQAKESKTMFVKGSSPSAGFFGQPELIEAGHVVAVAEGMADTAALQLWAAGESTVVAGAAGMNFLHHVAGELKAAGISVDGKVFALFPQNDRPLNKSRKEFVRLGQLLSAEGAHVVLCATPEEFKDVAEWRKARPDALWPPPELSKVLSPDVWTQEPELQLERPVGSAVQLEKAVRTNRYGQDFTTLVTLLDDPVHREAIFRERGELTINEMTDRPMWNGRELADSDLASIRLGLEAQGRSIEGKVLKFGKDDVRQALNLLASRRRVNPVRDYLRGLKWDGRQRIDPELPQALDQPLDGLEAHLLRRWLISAVARALQPGCKVDAMLVLVGPQGCGKSRFCEAIGGQWFTDEAINLEDKDSKLLLRSTWVLEWSELESMRRARDAESLKQFLSERVDKYRPPYGHDLVERPRHCVFIGTTNNEEFLTDPTGNRRFWPLSVKRVDVDWVLANRDQLLAEAVAAFDAREPWWLEEEYSGVLKEKQRDHEVRDEWFTVISAWLKSKPAITEITSGSVLEQVLEKPRGHWSRGDEMRVGAALRAYGWEKVRRRREGGVAWVYQRPGTGGDE
jgi:predicted P-loop ATPase